MSVPYGQSPFFGIKGNLITPFLMRFHTFQDVSKLCKIDEPTRKDNGIVNVPGHLWGFSRDID